MGKIILGVDPGTLNTGYGIVREDRGDLKLVDFGVLQSSPGDFMAKKLFAIGSQLQEIIARFKPSAFVLEKSFFAKNADSAMKLGQARGVCLYEAQRAEIPIFEYNPTEVKKSLTGRGRAEKDQVQLMVQVMLNIGPDLRARMSQFDMSDALALAIHHGRVDSTQSLMLLREEIL